MKNLLFVAICCLCLCGCGNNEEKLSQTECINQSKGQITKWTLFHDNNKIYKIKRETKQNYDTLSELEEAEQSVKEYYNSMKQRYMEQGDSVLINITKSNYSLIQQITYDCKENGFFPNVGCDYKKEIIEFENDIINYTCVEK